MRPTSSNSTGNRQNLRDKLHDTECGVMRVSGVEGGRVTELFENAEEIWWLIT